MGCQQCADDTQVNPEITEVMLAGKGEHLAGVDLAGLDEVKIFHGGSN